VLREGEIERRKRGDWSVVFVPIGFSSSRRGERGVASPLSCAPVIRTERGEGRGITTSGDWSAALWKGRREGRTVSGHPPRKMEEGGRDSQGDLQRKRTSGGKEGEKELFRK